MGYRPRLLLEQFPSNSEIYGALTSRERLLYWIAGINFVAFVVLAFVIGGNAFNGGIEGNRYYIGSDGAQSEVSGVVFAYSVIHTLSLFITHPVGLMLGFRGRRRVLRKNVRGSAPSAFHPLRTYEEPYRMRRGHEGGAE